MIEIYTYQVIIIVVCGLLFLRSLFSFVRGRKSFRELFLSALIWGGFSLISLFPVLIQNFADLLGFELGVNALLVLSTLLIFYILLKQAIRQSKIEASITKMVRNIALEDIKKTSL